MVGFCCFPTPVCVGCDAQADVPISTADFLGLRDKAGALASASFPGLSISSGRGAAERRAGELQ